MEHTGNRMWFAFHSGVKQAITQKFFTPGEISPRGEFHSTSCIRGLKLFIKRHETYYTR